MARNDGEGRMVFDIRGRRRNVVKVVYAILALLMGLSLFLLAGSGGIGSLFGGSSTNSAASQLEDQVATIERKLRKDPEDPQLLLNLARTRLSTGNALAVSDPETGQIAYTPESRLQLEQASEAWDKYLEATDEPSPSGAQVVAGALFGLAQTSSSGVEAEANVRAAAQAQAIVGEARPSLGSLSTLAIYRYFAFDYKGAEEARKKAAGFTNTKFERESLENELDQTAKRAHQFQKQLADAEKEAKKAREQGAKSGAASPLEENPFSTP